MNEHDWSFSKISGGFDNHVREQLPWYDITLDIVSFVVKNYASKNAVIYDIGSSTGNLKKILHDVINERQLNYFAIDNLAEMNPDVVADAREYEYQNFDVAILNLTLMFIPVKDRYILLSQLRDKMNKGGCIIIMDKFIQPEGYLATILRRVTLYWKYKNNVDGNEIIKKELSLSGIQIPLNYSELGSNAKQFLRFGEFEGFIITDI